MPTNMPYFKLGFPWSFGESVSSIFETIFAYVFVVFTITFILFLGFVFFVGYVIFYVVVRTWLEITLFFHKDHDK